MNVALDTNVLVYAEGVHGKSMKKAALDLLRRLPQDKTVLPVQTLGELFNVLTRKAGRSRQDARFAIISWQDAFSVIDTSAQSMTLALDLATDHQLSIWDALILAVSAKGGCRLLLSEDLQEGFTWAGLTVTNPFSSPAHPLLSALLDDTGKSSRDE